MKGLCLLAAPTADAQAAEACFEQALVISRHQGAKSLELRAALSLARLRQAQGNTRRPRALMAPTMARFTEGFATPDLVQAKYWLKAAA